MLNLLTSDICDAHLSSDPEALRVLPPVFHSYGGMQRFSGLISTVQCFEDNSHIKAAVDEPGEGRVLVVDAGGSLRKAVFGGNLGAAATRNGWAGVVIDGCARDVAELSQCALGVRALAVMPMPTVKRQQGLRDVAVKIQGVWVRPGEWLCADEDGIVICAQPWNPL